MSGDERAFLRALFDAAVAAADPLVRVPPFLPAPPAGRTVVVGAGKAAARMAQAVETAWPGELTGLVVTPPGYEAPCARVEVVTAAHPVPDAAGERAARQILALAVDLGPDDLLLALVSGGGSALLPAPPPGLTLDDERELVGDLLRSGAPISAINLVRKQCSEIKAGRLAAAAFPASVVGLLISDVPGDDPSDIASGPTVPERPRPREALAVLDRYEVAAPALRIHLAEHRGTELPRARVVNHVVATPAGSLAAAAERARQAGVAPVLLGDALEGESRVLGAELATLARDLPRTQRPAVLLSGGETTVRVRGDGVGGPNVELLLAFALAADGLPDVWALAADSDGIDGSAPVAGAVVTPDTLRRAAAQGISATDALARNDAHTFFAVLGDRVVTGPTRTNVNDIRAILVT